MSQKIQNKNITIVKEANVQQKIDDYVSEINRFLTYGKYWKALELMEKANQFVEKSKWAGKLQILYDKDKDLDDYINDYLCGATCAELCCSNEECCAGLIGAYCVCFCLTGENPAQGCDCVAGVWDNCCNNILCGGNCKL